MASVRQAETEDLPRLIDFYRQTSYSGGVESGDTVFLAEAEGRIIAALRLCLEGGTRVLRGMRVQAARQQQGTGTELLRAAAGWLGESECYCIPYASLESFYGQASFVRLDPESAPAFLRERWQSYRERGLDVILMRRQGG
jgi:N-acetylglutamate synthase-like GNAT family acetyltransferase